ncbi:hypothetical protein V8E53_015333 [Lactarius tabidus]
MLVVGLIIGGLVVNLGGSLEHTRCPLKSGALGRFLGLLLGIIYAAFSTCGMEIITLAAAETRNPRKNLVTAMRIVFFQIFICYVSRLYRFFKQSGNAGQSPFVFVFNQVGVKVLTSAFLSTNGMLYSASSPKVVTKVTCNGVSYVAILTGGVFSLLAFLNFRNSSGKVFNLLKYGFCLWMASMSSTVSIFQPYAGMSVIFILVNMNLPIFTLLCVGWKVIKRKLIHPLSQFDFTTGIPSLERPMGIQKLQQFL